MLIDLALAKRLKPQAGRVGYQWQVMGPDGVESGRAGPAGPAAPGIQRFRPESSNLQSVAG